MGIKSLTKDEAKRALIPGIALCKKPLRLIQRVPLPMSVLIGTFSGCECCGSQDVCAKQLETERHHQSPACSSCPSSEMVDSKHNDDD